MAFVDVSASFGRVGQPRMKAVCDRCQREEVFACPKGDEGHARKRIQEMGWALIKGDLRCPKCEAKRKAEGMKQKAQPAAPAREPTRAQRREIIGMLEVSYDVEGERYKGGETDETVAEVLDVLPGWVAAIREEFFGPAGSNEDIDALALEVKAFLKDAADKLAARKREVGELSAVIERVESYGDRLNKIKRAVGPRALARAK